MSDKKIPGLGSMKREFVPGTWLVEPKDEFTNKLLTSRLGAEMRYDNVPITPDKTAKVMWEVDHDMMKYLYRRGKDVDFDTYRVSLSRFPIQRDYPKPSLKLY